MILKEDYDYDLNASWYQKFIKNGEVYAFTPVHSIKSLPFDTEVPLISFIRRVYDINNSEKHLGNIVISLKYEDIMMPLKKVKMGIMQYLILDGNSEIIFKGIDEKYYQSTLEVIKSKPAEENNYYETKDSYVIVSYLPMAKWRMVGLIPKSQLLNSLKYINLFFVFTSLAGVVIVILILLPFINHLTVPVLLLKKAMTKVSGGDLDVRVDIRSNDEIETLANVFNQMTNEIKQFIQRIKEKESAEKDMKLRILITQINPHFIYNTLNIVIYMARRIGAEDIIKVTTAFIDILQYTIKIEDVVYTTVDEEIEYINNYTTIQRYRYGNMFSLNWEVDRELLNAPIPRMLLFPLVENAFFHGICPKGAKGTVTISIQKLDFDMAIFVDNNGVGMDKSRIQELLEGESQEKEKKMYAHIGVKNVNERLKVIFGDEYGLAINSAHGKGTRVYFRIPLDDGLKKI